MKNSMGLLIALTLSIFTAYNTFGNNPTFENQMETALEKMNATPINWLTLASDFETIMNENEKEWLPFYYYALAKTKGIEKVQGASKDALLDEAQAALDKAIKLQPTESELFTLQANIYMMRIAVDPSRGMSHSSLTFKNLKKAKQLNEDNPRVYLLYGLMVYNMPQQFGGGELAAANWFYTAKEKYESFEAKSSLHPTWGNDTNEKMLELY